MDELNIDFGFNKQFPNAVRKNTCDSETSKQIKDADKQMQTKKGVSFYCGKRNQYIFIENS